MRTYDEIQEERQHDFWAAVFCAVVSSEAMSFDRTSAADVNEAVRDAARFADKAVDEWKRRRGSR